jgi:hypothetical protein
LGRAGLILPLLWQLNRVRYVIITSGLAILPKNRSIQSKARALFMTCRLLDASSFRIVLILVNSQQRQLVPVFSCHFLIGRQFLCVTYLRARLVWLIFQWLFESTF